MTVRAVEGKQPYTGGTAIEIDENKVISLRLRDENNLIIYDEGDDEIYVDLQLPDEITPTDAFPVGITTGRVIVDNGWDTQGTLICAKTTSGDNIKILYADDGKLYMDNGTGSFKQIYFKADVDLIIQTLTTYINGELAKKQNGVTSDTAPINPSQGDLWYDTVNDVLKVYDGTQWNTTGGGGSGDVTGPASATDGHLAVFDGATGKLIKDGGAMPTIPSITTISVTLTTAGWSSSTQTVTATGVTASNTVIVSPDPSYMSDYTDGGVYCSTQGTNSLTFVCSSTPSNDIDVNVVIIS